jgi:hypothetical protein
LRDLARVIGDGTSPAVPDTAVIAAANRSLTIGELAAAGIIAEGLPDDVRLFYSSILSRIRRRNEALLDQLCEAGRALNERGIAPVLFKGSAELAACGHVLPRLLSDLDLMVSPADREEALAALRALGYEAISETGPAGATLARSKDVGAIDLHTSLKIPLPNLSFGAIVGASRLVDIRGATFLLPSEVVRAAVIIVHDQLQERDYWTGAIDLRHLHDVARLCSGFGDKEWKQLRGYFPAGFTTRALHTQLATLAELFGALKSAPVDAGLRVRMQVHRRFVQVRWPWLRLPFTALSVLADPPKRSSEARAPAVRQTDGRLRKAATKYLQRRPIGKY